MAGLGGFDLAGRSWSTASSRIGSSVFEAGTGRGTGRGGGAGPVETLDAVAFWAPLAHLVEVCQQCPYLLWWRVDVCPDFSVACTAHRDSLVGEHGYQRGNRGGEVAFVEGLSGPRRGRR